MLTLRTRHATTSKVRRTPRSAAALILAWRRQLHLVVVRRRYSQDDARWFLGASCHALVRALPRRYAATKCGFAPHVKRRRGPSRLTSSRPLEPRARPL